MDKKPNHTKKKKEDNISFFILNCKLVRNKTDSLSRESQVFNNVLSICGRKSKITRAVLIGSVTCRKGNALAKRSERQLGDRGGARPLIFARPHRRGRFNLPRGRLTVTPTLVSSIYHARGVLAGPARTPRRISPPAEDSALFSIRGENGLPFFGPL